MCSLVLKGWPNPNHDFDQLKTVIMKYKIISLITICFWFTMNACTNNKPGSGVSPELETESLATLRKVLNDESEWVKVHAAEFLIWSGHPDGVREVFLEEEKLFATKSQYRIGIWRVLAQTESDSTEKKIWTDKIMAAFLDTSGTDRIHAVETLAKLKISPLAIDEKITQQAMESPVSGLATYAQWSAAYTSQEWCSKSQMNFLNRIVSGLDSGAVESQAAYILRQFGALPESEWKMLAQAVLSESADAKPNVYLHSAAFVTVPDGLRESAEMQKLHEAIIKFSESSSKGDRSEVAIALSINGSAGDVPVLEGLLRGDHPLPVAADNADVSAAAGYALLKLSQKLSAASEK
jgi:hypothetical protein